MISRFLKFKTFFCFLFPISITLSAEAIIEAKAGYFTFSNSTLRKVYHQGGVDIQLSATYPLWELGCDWTVNAYGSLEYFQKSGKSMNGDESTSIKSFPINIGIKPSFAIDENVHYYFAVGPRYFYIRQHNDSASVYRSRSRNGLGLFVNTGFNYFFCNGIRLDVFGEYSYGRVHFHSGSSTQYTRNIQVGGYTVGGGVGYAF